jgi:hypothetical protein
MKEVFRDVYSMYSCISKQVGRSVAATIEFPVLALRRRDRRRAHRAAGPLRGQRAREERYPPDQDQQDQVDHIDLRRLAGPAP